MQSGGLNACDGLTNHSRESQSCIVQGDETFDVVANSQFTVSRTAHRNNNSDYYIDDKKSSFTEVTKLLKSKGIDLDNNRFLILQVTLHVRALIDRAHLPFVMTTCFKSKASDIDKSCCRCIMPSTHS